MVELLCLSCWASVFLTIAYLMTDLEQREFRGIRNGRNLRTDKVNGQWRWIWGDWSSKPYSYLEIRPWSPQIIGGELCFSAFDGNSWRVVWGDREGPPLDDAFDILEYENEPIYIAKQESYYFLIRGNIYRTQRFNRQITFRIGIDDIEIASFGGHLDWSNSHSAIWNVLG